jgi:hypothetical protein
MDRQDFMGLYESYMDVYGDEEYIDESKADENLTPLQKIRKRNQDPSLVMWPGGRTEERRMYHRARRGVKKERGAKSAFDTMRHVGGPYKEEVDLYDLVLEYLLDEGLCESVENAEIMMAHMSEQWVDSIIEEGAKKVVMSVTSPSGKPRRLNTTRATGPAQSLDGGPRLDAYRQRDGRRANREAISFTPQAERAARTRNQDQISGHRQGFTNMRSKYVTRGLQRRYGIPDSALDPIERSKGIPNRAVDLR